MGADARVRVQVSAGFVLGAGVKAKTMTNNLPILSVLWLVVILDCLNVSFSISSSHNRKVVKVTSLVA